MEPQHDVKPATCSMVGSSVIVLPFMVFVSCLRSSRLLRAPQQHHHARERKQRHGHEQPDLDQREQLVERHHAPRIHETADLFTYFCC
jgi:hypothetical protein